MQSQHITGFHRCLPYL